MDRVEYHADGWQRPVKALAEGQTIIRPLADDRRLSVVLTRFPGSTGPGKIASASIQVLEADRWGRRRRRPAEYLGPHDLALVEAAS